MKKCPFCAEEIQPEAIICRFCKYDLGTGAVSQAYGTPAPIVHPAPAGQPLRSGEIWCPSCHYRGKASRVGWDTTGCLLTVILLALGIIPGIIYIVWRDSQAAKVQCPQCLNRQVVRKTGLSATVSVITVLGVLLLAICGFYAVFPREEVTRQTHSTFPPRPPEAPDKSNPADAAKDPPPPQPRPKVPEKKVNFHDIDAVIEHYGKPDTDDSTQYDNPRPPMVTRWLIYKDQDLRLWYLPDAKALEAPPYKGWKFLSFAEESTDKPLSIEAGYARMQSRLKKKE